MKLVLAAAVFLSICGHEVLGKKEIDWKDESEDLFDGFSQAYNNQQFEDLIKKFYTKKFTRISPQKVTTELAVAIKDFQAMHDMGFHKVEFYDFTIFMESDNEVVESHKFKLFNCKGPDKIGNCFAYIHLVKGKAKIKYSSCH